jgi:hypothetical protein
VDAHNAQDHRQAHAPAGELGREKRIEELLDIPSFNSLTPIRYLQAGIDIGLRLPI